MVCLGRKNVLLSSLKLDFKMWLRGRQVIGTIEKLAQTPVLMMLEKRYELEKVRKLATLPPYKALSALKLTFIPVTCSVSAGMVKNGIGLAERKPG